MEFFYISVRGFYIEEGEIFIKGRVGKGFLIDFFYSVLEEWRKERMRKIFFRDKL